MAAVPGAGEETAVMRCAAFSNPSLPCTAIVTGVSSFVAAVSAAMSATAVIMIAVLPEPVCAPPDPVAPPSLTENCTASVPL